MRPALILTSALLSFHALANDPPPSSVVSQADATHEKQDVYEFFTYFSGQTAGADDVLTGVAVIKPGEQIHPPHTHAEEEYLMVIEGSGTWSLKGDTFAASAGDILYAAPWDSHGIENTGDTPLKFVVFKWRSKGLPESK